MKKKITIEKNKLLTIFIRIKAIARLDAQVIDMDTEKIRNLYNNKPVSWISPGHKIKHAKIT